jgi:hypothetical protein
LVVVVVVAISSTCILVRVFSIAQIILPPSKTHYTHQLSADRLELSFRVWQERYIKGDRKGDISEGDFSSIPNLALDHSI